MLRQSRALLSQFFRRHPRYHGLNELDRKLEAHLDFDRGIFVEAGANDGLNQSNTLYFETCRRWRGLLVEPIPALAERCRRNRPRALVECCALVPLDDAGKTLTMVDANLMSLVRGAMKTAEDERRHIATASAIHRPEPREGEGAGHAPSLLLAPQSFAHVPLPSLAA